MMNQGEDGHVPGADGHAPGADDHVPTPGEISFRRFFTKHGEKPSKAV